MKSQKEIYQALIDGSMLVDDLGGTYYMDENGMILEKSKTEKSFNQSFDDFSRPENYEIYEPPKPKKRYWQWKVLGPARAWFRVDAYYCDQGFTTSGVRFVDWENTEKIKIEDDYIDVEE